MSGSQACRDPPHGPFEKEMCHLKAEKNKLNHSGCLLSQILFLIFYVLFACVYVFSFHSITPLCPYYVCSNPIMIIFDIFSMDGHHLAFYMTEHTLKV